MAAGAEGQESARRPSGSQVTASVVEVQLGTRRVWALVDSGADFTMIRDVLQENVQRELGCRLTLPSQTSRGAGGEPLHITGVVNDLTVEIQGKPFATPSAAVVKGLTDVRVGPGA